MGHNINSTGKRLIVLEVLAGGGLLIEAAATAGIAYQTLAAWRKKDPEFRAKCDEAVKMGTAVMVAEARRRAVHGVTEPLVKGGTLVKEYNERTGELEQVYIRKHSDTLLMFVLKSRDPETYCDTVRAKRIERRWNKKDGKAGTLPYTIDGNDTGLV